MFWRPFKWDNCVAFRENYLGDYKDGWMSGHGIEFGSFGNFYIGNFVEDYKEEKEHNISVLGTKM